MAILQISKIQQRSGNLVDLPQLDDAEFGWANDARRLFIGKSSPNENIEVLTSYSTISFSQVDGAIGNINISPVNIADGQILTYDGTDWVNRGGDAGGLITLGDVSNVKLTGGAIGYVLQTDGLGNLSWTPKGTIVAGILNVSKANPAVVTTVADNFFTDGSQVTIVDPQGMTQLAGNIYYANALTSTTFALYTDSGLTTGVNSTSFTTYAYTTVSATTVSTNRITVANSAPFTIGAAVQFIGNMSTSNISNIATYYVESKPTATTLRIATSADANASNVVPLQTTSGLSAQVYQIGGEAVATLGTSVTFSPAGGTNTTVQFNANGSLQGSGSFTYDSGSSILTLVGNANVGNLNATGVGTATRFISNIATGTAPLVVTSTTQVANLNVATSGSVVNGNSNVNIPSANGNVNISATGNANIVVVTGTGANISGTLNVTGNANVGNLGTATAIITTGNITTINSGLLQNGTSNVVVTAAGGNVTLGVAGTARITATSTGANVNGTLGVTGNANVGNLGATTVVFTSAILAGGANARVFANGITASGAMTGNANASTITGNLGIRAIASTYTDNSAAASATLANAAIHGLGTPTLAAANLTVTSTNAATFFIQGAPAAGTNMTITNPYALHVASGNSLFADTVTAGNLSTGGALNVTGNANVGNLTGTQVFATANVTAPQLVSNVATGTAPLEVSSTTRVANLNVAYANVADNINVTAPGTGLGYVVFANAISGNVTEWISPGISSNLANNSITATTFVGALSGAATTAGTVTTNAQPNITSVGTLTSLGVNGTVTAVSFTANTGVFTGNGAALANLNASNISSGTLGQARLANSNVILGSTTLTLGTTTTTVAGLTSLTATTVTGTLTTNAQPNITSVGTLISLGVTGNVTAGNVYANSGTVGAANVLTPVLTTGANTTPGSITGNWTLTAGSRMEATYADLAEYYEADDIYGPGTVLMFGGEKEVTIAEDGTSRVAGVVSSNPAYVMNATCPGLLTAIALQGRVPCKVRGKISKGDMLISGGNGFARPNQFPTMGTVIGKALQDFDGYEGIIEVAVGRL